MQVHSLVKFDFFFLFHFLWNHCLIIKSLLNFSHTKLSESFGFHQTKKSVQKQLFQFFGAYPKYQICKHNINRFDEKVLPRGELNPTLLVNKAINNPFSLGLDLTPFEFFREYSPNWGNIDDKEKPVIEPSIKYW